MFECPTITTTENHIDDGLDSDPSSRRNPSCRSNFVSALDVDPPAPAKPMIDGALLHAPECVSALCGTWPLVAVQTPSDDGQSNAPRHGPATNRPRERSDAGCKKRGDAQGLFCAAAGKSISRHAAWVPLARGGGRWVTQGRRQQLGTCRSQTHHHRGVCAGFFGPSFFHAAHNGIHLQLLSPTLVNNHHTYTCHHALHLTHSNIAAPSCSPAPFLPARHRA